jgi:transcriptional regulator GlxA family with amidase domain
LTRTVGIYLYDEVEVLDFAGPFEVFVTASRIKSRIQPNAKPAFDVFTIGAVERTITARGGLRVQTQYDLSTHPKLDVLIIPGGIITEELLRRSVIDWIGQIARGAELTASVCTGAFLLGEAGLLDGLPATTHWEDTAELQAMFPDINVQEGTRWVEAGNIVTAAGISAGIDMSLHLVARLESEALAAATARQMEYDWQRSGTPHSSFSK